MKKSYATFLLCGPGWYFHPPDIQNKWDDNTHTQQHVDRKPMILPKSLNASRSSEHPPVRGKDSCSLKKNQSAPRASEHPPVMSKRLGGIKGCKYKTSSWHLNRFPDADNIGSTVYCRGEAHRYTVHLHLFISHLTDPLRIQPWSQDRRNKTTDTGVRYVL